LRTTEAEGVGEQQRLRVFEKNRGRGCWRTEAEGFGEHSAEEGV